MPEAGVRCRSLPLRPARLSGSGLGLDALHHVCKKAEISVAHSQHAVLAAANAKEALGYQTQAAEAGKRILGELVRLLCSVDSSEVNFPAPRVLHQVKELPILVR